MIVQMATVLEWGCGKVTASPTEGADMLKLNIAKGITGITAIRNANRCGWHIVTDVDDVHNGEYSTEAFVYTVKQYNDLGYILAGVTGNGLVFAKQ